MELEDEGAPISVTLIKPASIDTPFFDKARSHLGVEPQPVPPVYAPEVVAEVPFWRQPSGRVRELIVGGSGRLLSLSSLAPRLTDAYMERTLFDSQKTDRPVFGRPDNLFGPVAETAASAAATGRGERFAAALRPRWRCIRRSPGRRC